MLEEVCELEVALPEGESPHSLSIEDMRGRPLNWLLRKDESHSKASR